jgi:hypothetical protein
MADLVITAANVAKGSDATVENGTAGATVTAGQAVYLDTADGRLKLADNNGTGTRSVRGVALHGAAAGQPLQIQRAGDITIGATMTAGAAYYLSATAGGIAPAADLAAGMDPILIGMAKSTTVLTIDIIDVGVTL